ncbi:AraC family transcriptional regulator [Desulfomicrobium norvegicum]|nr:AraC family transcriptional regulator [Desulfomicrobium norvegicum]
MECLRATYIQHHFAPHAHAEFVIGVIETGAQRVRYRGGHEIMPERSLCVINPGELHTGHAATSAGWSYSTIYPDPSLLVDVASQIKGKLCGVPNCGQLVNFDYELADEFKYLHRALFSGMASRLARQSLLLQFLARLVTRHFDIQPPSELPIANRRSILRTRDYLQEHFGEQVALEELARLANLSPFHFARSFTRFIGISPHAYQLQIRIREAKLLLASGMPIAQVAVSTGFADQSHLANRFKAVCGITPRQYLKVSKKLQEFPDS